MQGPRAQGGAQGLHVPQGNTCLEPWAPSVSRPAPRLVCGQGLGSAPHTCHPLHLARRRHSPVTWPSRKQVGPSCAGRAESPSFSEGPTVEEQDRSLGTSDGTGDGAPRLLSVRSGRRTAHVSRSQRSVEPAESPLAVGRLLCGLAARLSGPRPLRLVCSLASPAPCTAAGGAGGSPIPLPPTSPSV